MSEASLYGLFQEAIREHWNDPAFSDFRLKTVTFAQVARRIRFFHLLYRKAQLKPGDRIAVCGPNSANWAVAYLSAMTYGAVIVPILADFHAEDIHHIVNHSESKLLFASEGVYEKVDEDKMPLLMGIFSLEDERLTFGVKHDLAPAIEWARNKIGEEALSRETFSFGDYPGNGALASLVYTSGTTGFSKGVQLPYRSLLANVLFARENITLARNAPMVSFLPMAHSYSCSFEFLFPFSLGCHITFLGKIPSPKILLEAFGEVKPHVILSVPLLMEKIFRKRIAPRIGSGPAKLLLKTPGLSRLVCRKIRQSLLEAFGGRVRQLVIGGAALNPEVENFFLKIRLPFTVGYGMTECGPLISYAPPAEHRAGAVGKAISCLEAKIDSPDPEKVVGEIMVRGENVMDGYFKNLSATKEVLGPDGWLRTGDLGVIDADGFIFIRGRNKNMILGPSGQNIYPEEIESKINSLEFVQESLVLDAGGKLVALVYPDWEAIDAQHGRQQDREGWLAARMEEVRRSVNRELPRYAALSRIKVQAEPFEKTPTQKIKRYLYKT